MQKAYFILAVVGAFLIGFFVACGDEVYSASIQRYVYEVTEANVTGAGGVIKVPVLKVGQEGDGGREMAMVAVYGSGYTRNNQWRMLNEVDISEGEVKINAGQGSEYPSHYYRVIVIY
jgi:hypothetical protein